MISSSILAMMVLLLLAMPNAYHARPRGVGRERHKQMTEKRNRWRNNSKTLEWLKLSLIVSSFDMKELPKLL
jgi:hypothetical protein